MTEEKEAEMIVISNPFPEKGERFIPSSDLLVKFKHDPDFFNVEWKRSCTSVALPQFEVTEGKINAEKLLKHVLTMQSAYDAYYKEELQKKIDKLKDEHFLEHRSRIFEFRKTIAGLEKQKEQKNE